MELLHFSLIAANVFRLGDGGAFKAQKFSFAKTLIEFPKFKFITSAPLLPNRCCAFVLFWQLFVNDNSDLTVSKNCCQQCGSVSYRMIVAVYGAMQALGQVGFRTCHVHDLQRRLVKVDTLTCF